MTGYNEVRLDANQESYILRGMPPILYSSDARGMSMVHFGRHGREPVNQR